MARTWQEVVDEVFARAEGKLKKNSRRPQRGSQRD